MRVEVDHKNGRFRVLVLVVDSVSWGLGTDFLTHNAALGVATAIADAKRSEGTPCAVIDKTEEHEVRR